MARPFFADYVNRLLRWYCRAQVEGKEVTLAEELDRQNWTAVENIMENLEENDKNVIMNVYCRKETMLDSVTLTAKELDVPQNRVWLLIKKVSKKVAEERGLL